MRCQPIAYLASEYPAISHTFILREVLGLRRLGLAIRTASINRPAHLASMPDEDRRESEATLYIKDTPIGTVIRAHLSLLLRQPIEYAGMLRKALSLASGRSLSVFLAVAYFAEAAILVDWMRRRKIAHVHVHFVNPAATVALIASASGLVSYSLSVHGPNVFDDVSRNLLVDKVRDALFVRCISHYCRGQVQRLADFQQWPKIHVVRCGVDPEVFVPQQESAREYPEMLCVGRLTPAKGQHVLLQACCLLRERNVPFHVTFVGDGPSRPSLEAAARDLGIDDAEAFAGVVGQGQILAYYNQADVFVLPSFAEGLPVVLMEAMSAGLPCVSTRIAGIPELIEDGTNGVLTSAADSKGLADRLETLLSDPDLRVRLGERARETVELRYTLERSCRRMAELFRTYLTP